MFTSFSSLVIGLPDELRLVAPLAAAFDVMEGSKEDQAAVSPKKAVRETPHLPPNKTST